MLVGLIHLKIIFKKNQCKSNNKDKNNCVSTSTIETQFLIKDFQRWSACTTKITFFDGGELQWHYMLCKTNPRVSLSLFLYKIHLYHCILHKHVQHIVWKPTYLHWRNFREVRESLVVGKISRCEPVLKWPLQLFI